MTKLNRMILLALLGVTALRAQETFEAFTERAAMEWVRTSPQQATEAQYFTGAEQDALDRQLVAFIPDTALPLEPAVREARLALARRLLDGLAKFERARLTPEQQLVADVVASTLRTATDTAPLADHWFIFQQMRGLHVGLVNFLTNSHPIRNRRDIENYLARLQFVAPLLDAGIGQARAQAEKGILPPRFILTAVQGQLDLFLAPAPEKNVFVTSLDERAATLTALSAAERQAFAAEAAKIVGEKIQPAFRRVRTLIASQIPGAKDDAGIWRLPRGAAAYELALRQYTTTSRTADEIHELGLREVARIEKEMDGLLRQLGHTEGSVSARYDKVNQSLIPPLQPDPRPALLADYTRIIRDAERRSESYFDLRPKAPVEVRREPAMTEATAAAHYSMPAPDGSRPGIFWAPLPEGLKTIWVGAGMKSVAYHEAVPGHHFQLALQQELPGLPRFQRQRIFGSSTAYSEGWGLYAEKLAAEAGWYEGDLAGHLGQLQLELFRARRLVVDTGLHAKRWTRQQAIDYGIQAQEIDRYIVTPGQACAYKIGELEILRLRAKAQQALGPKFSMKEFHNEVLRHGTLPLSVLGSVIDRYISRTR